MAIVAGVTVYSSLIMLEAGTRTEQQERSITTTQAIAERQVNQSALDAVEAESLAFIREEEKMARDVYDAMYVLWPDKPIFDQISDSEQEHMDAILTLLDKYGLPDPAQGPGVFTDPDIQGLYDWLISRGEVSEIDALYAGAFIEEYDIHDLQMAIEETDNPDVQQVYSNLEQGSENHLRAYVGLIEETGVIYEAQWLTQTEVDEILAASSQPGKRTTNQHR